MRIQVEKFLAITALLASTAALGVGCTTEDTATNTDAGVSGSGGTATGGSGGTAGAATGGQAGTVATGGTAGGGGTAGAAGGGGTAGAAGGDGGSCLGDAGTEVNCASLSYYSTVCGDAGAEGTIAPLGADLCDYLAASGRLGVTAQVFTCLNAITGDACSAAHDTAVQKCIDDNFPLACQKPPLTDPEGGTYDPCADVASTCLAAGSEPGITKAECDAVLNVLNDTAEAAVLTCYDTPVTSSCSDDFYNCVGLP